MSDGLSSCGDRLLHPVVTRFAPTPNGLLHFGSLVAALASYLFARSHGGLWHLRFDDLDTLRVRKEWADGILFQLEAFGFEWDGAVVRQSDHIEEYVSWLHAAERAGLLFRCSCSRKDLELGPAKSNRWGETVHPSTCVALSPSGGESLRWILPASPDSRPLPFEFIDGVQGVCRIDDAWAELGPFVVRRADGVIAYHLANALDDTRMGITHSVRGADLIPSAFRQIALHRQGLGRLSVVPNLPHFAHVPLATGADGMKLGKSRFSPQIDSDQASTTLVHALSFLGQNPLALADLGGRARGAGDNGPVRMRALLGAAAAQFRLDAIPSQLHKCADI
jgi:glutamyl-Q tRNA(Asp) synthetase